MGVFLELGDNVELSRKSVAWTKSWPSEDSFEIEEMTAIQREKTRTSRLR